MSEYRGSNYCRPAMRAVPAAGWLCLFSHCSGRKAIDEKTCYCSPSVLLEETRGCQIGTVEAFNAELSPHLERLLETPFFRYFKVNLRRPCVLWDENPACVSEGCSISVLSKDPVNWESWLSDVRYPSEQATKSLFKAWDYDEDEFCLLDPAGENGSYVDLTENPERFTGYMGPNANRVWTAMYEENCFSTEELQKNPLSDSSWAQCTERQVFYRVVSGLHASISTHLSYDWFNKETAQWEPNLKLFDARVGGYIDRLRNMYLVYMLVCSAILKITDRLDAMTFLPDDSENNALIHRLLTRIASNLPQLPAEFDHVVFSSDATPQIIREFKRQFKRLMKVMDCVSCERCRLWGKIQITGVGTALKIIFNYNDPIAWDEMVLRRSEIIALYNTFGRLSESVVAVEEFREMYSKQSAVEPDRFDHFKLHDWAMTVLHFLFAHYPATVVSLLLCFILPVGIIRLRRTTAKCKCLLQ